MIYNMYNRAAVRKEILTAYRASALLDCSSLSQYKPPDKYMLRTIVGRDGLISTQQAASALHRSFPAVRSWLSGTHTIPVYEWIKLLILTDVIPQDLSLWEQGEVRDFIVYCESKISRGGE